MNKLYYKLLNSLFMISVFGQWVVAPPSSSWSSWTVTHQSSMARMPKEIQSIINAAYLVINGADASNDALLSISRTIWKIYLCQPTTYPGKAIQRHAINDEIIEASQIALAMEEISDQLEDITKKPTLIIK